MSANNYSPGDKVRVRKDLNVDKRYDNWDVSAGMERLAGKIVTIKSINQGFVGKYYTIDEYTFGWTDSMFEDYIQSAENDISIKDDNSIVFDKSVEDLINLYKG